MIHLVMPQSKIVTITKIPAWSTKQMNKRNKGGLPFVRTGRQNRSVSN